MGELKRIDGVRQHSQVSGTTGTVDAYKLV